MRFLLAAVNAKYIHSNPAIYSLRAYAGRELQSHIVLAEYTINQRMQDILADLYGRKPDCIGFSCYIWNWELIRELLAELPKILPGTDIWLGGPEVSFDAPEVLTQFPQVKGIMVGEGEATFRELLQWYVDEEREPERLGQIQGLCLHTGCTAARELTDMNTLPFLYAAEASGPAVSQQTSGPGTDCSPEAADALVPFEHKIIYYESSRGCPYRCSYCLSSIDKKVRLRDIEIVKRELQFFLDRRVKQVKFLDRTFNCDHRHAMEIWRYLYEHDNGVTNFHFEISADILREEEIALLNKLRPGLAQLEIGVQSTNPETIRAINRVMDVERLERVVAEIHKGHNIHLHLDLITGLPYENYDSFVNSFNRVYAMKPEQLQLGFLKVLKGSPMEEKAEEYGIVYLDRPPYEVLYTKWLSYEEVLRLKRVEEMVELYYNSCQFTHTLPCLERLFAHPFAMYEALAEYYREKNYFVESPARAHRYQVLLEFAVQRDRERADFYRELLTYDMYLRENLKSRPAFAMDTWERADVKEHIREFYRQEEREHAFLPDYGEYDWKQLSRMTHMEPFRFPVWDSEEVKEADMPLYYVLFDYRNRNPLTYEAGTQVIL